MATPEPSKIRAGANVKWERSVSSDYSAADGWSLEYRLNATDLSTIQISTTGSGTTYTVDHDSTVTGAWAAGTYTWTLIATKGDDKHVLDTGLIEVVAFDATGNDLIDAQNNLDKAETELAARAEGKASSYSIKDRSLTRADVDELMKIVSYWRKRVKALKSREARRKGRANPNISYVRFK